MRSSYDVSIQCFLKTGAKIISKKVANNANDDDRTNPVMGSPALVKVREAVMGPHGQNLNDPATPGWLKTLKVANSNDCIYVDSHSFSLSSHW